MTEFEKYMVLSTKGNSPFEVLSCYFLFKGEDNSRLDKIGISGKCRFCGADSPRLFKKKAHTVPKSLGNSRIISLDECDECNQRFGRYEEHLIRFFAPYLSFVGLVSDKKTPKTKDNNVALQLNKNAARKGHDTVLMAYEKCDTKKIFPSFHQLQTGGVAEIELPVSKYIPILTYLALCKQAISIMPIDDLSHFKNLLTALKYGRFTHDENFPETHCIVATLKTQGAYPTWLGSILYRRNDKNGIVDPRMPRWLYSLIFNDVMLQVPLLSDDWWSGQYPSYNQFSFAVDFTSPPDLGLRNEHINSSIKFVPESTTIFSGTQEAVSPFKRIRIKLFPS